MKVWNGKTEFRYAHIKRDGWGITVLKEESGKVTTYSTRNYNTLDLDFLPVMANVLSRVPCSTQINCELWKPGAPASYVSSGIANKDRAMKLEVFSVPAGLPAPLGLEYVKLEVTRWGMEFIPFYDKQNTPLSLGPWVCPTELPLQGLGYCEGYVLKDSNAGHCEKWKQFLTVDLIVTGWTIGKGKHRDGIGGLVCSLANGEEVANISGMTDAERKVINALKLKNELLGKVVEVRYQYVASQGRLRHASFVRFRTDKGADKELPSNE